MKADAIHYITITLRYLLIGVTVLFLIRFFVIEPGVVLDRSMEPTMQNGEVFAVEKLSSLFFPLRRGEIVQVGMPDVHYLLVKRVIGLPGETVIIKNGNVTITDLKRNNIQLSEPYIRPYGVLTEKPKDLTVTVPDNEYFIMGDNRPNSSDSRVFGPVHRAYIIGRVIRLNFLKVFTAGQ